jgi:hypothetical protein
MAHFRFILLGPLIFVLHAVILKRTKEKRFANMKTPNVINCISCDGSGKQAGALKNCVLCDGTGKAYLLPKRNLAPLIRRIRAIRSTPKQKAA